MRQTGIVVKKEQDQVFVKMQDLGTICGSCKGCVRLSPPRQTEEYVVAVADPKNQYAVGDKVVVEGEIRHLVQAVSLLYAIPFVFLLFGYFLTRLIVGSDPFAGLGAIGGLLLGAVIARPLARRLSNKEQNLKIISRACS